MEKKDGLTKILAIFGTVLIWFPDLAPFLAGIAVLFRDGIYERARMAAQNRIAPPSSADGNNSAGMR